MKSNHSLKITGVVLFFIFLPGMLWAQNVVLPITIDYPLLKSMVMSQVFTGTEKETELLGDPKGCKKIVITDLDFREENSLLRFEIKVQIKSGFEFMNICTFPIEWEGYVVFFQNPVITPESWILSFKTMDSLVLDKNHEHGIIAGAFWKLIKEKVHTYVDDIRIDLRPSVEEIKSFLVDVFPEGMHPQALVMIETMRPGNVEVQGNAVQIAINTDVSSVCDTTRTLKEERLNDMELAALIGTWETMDAFIVYLIRSLTPLDEKEKDIVLETLLDTRYRFIAELAKPVHENDFVRNQFMAAWDSLSVVFKNHTGKKLDTSPLGALSFLSSMDALKVLDSIGPAIGIEITHNGFIRLARLMNDKKIPDLFYSLEQDKELRKLMDLDPELKESLDDTMDEPEIDNDTFLKDILNKILTLFHETPKWMPPYATAIAGQSQKTDAIHLEKWIPNQSNTSEYVKKIRNILKQTAEKTATKNKRDREYHDFFHLIIPAVAWQESCLRQFELNNGEIEYLRSYNNTSVGVMQVNERVWRGLYDPEKLRWNIRYNIEAGCEIADLYLNRYVFKKLKEKKLPLFENKDNIARILYALYNGGPGEFSKFLKRSAKEKFYLSDKLFYEKYLWVKTSQWENADICLVGK